MQPLPKGITGFKGITDFNAPNGGVPVKRFKAACYAAVRQVAGGVHQVRTAYEWGTLNFHEALMTVGYRLEMVRVLCNAHYPIVGFAAPAVSEGDMDLEFIDCPELAEALSAEFSIITRQDACASVAEELVAQLGDAELHQIGYWQPQRIGDVIFNYWD